MSKFIIVLFLFCIFNSASFAQTLVLSDVIKEARDAEINQILAQNNRECNSDTKAETVQQNNNEACSNNKTEEEQKS
ncbi:MAG: hypothetical protein LUG16_08235 [Candidatus Gastranaerophilales bacterium]|nr:hypothetical protein [Candidatus Gastranaerophilales bacterium]